MVSQRLLQTRLFVAFMAVFTACAAALFAHIAIDLAGDFLLAHDTYDGIAHQSRSEIFAGGAVALATVLLRVIWRALAEASGGERRKRLRFEDVFGRAPWRFAAAAVLLALPALMLMEYADVAAAGGRIDDLTDLLGGSIALSASITMVCAIVCAAVVRHIARFVLASHDGLVAALGRIIALLTRSAAGTSLQAAPALRRPVLRQRSILSRRSGKRGPPLFAC